MGRPKKLRNFIGILKDKGSMIKSTLLSPPNTSSIHRAIVRATTHGPATPPANKRVEAILTFGHGSRNTACACIISLMDRLHNSQNAAVALKCLYTLHNIIARGSFILKDQLSSYPSAGGQNFLNLSKFRDQSDADTWELSSWVRWYASILEQNLMACRVLGSYFCSSSSRNYKEKQKISSLSNDDLTKDIDVLVGVVVQVSEAPDSLYLQKNSLVHELVRIVGEDYRFAQQEIFARVAECSDRTAILSSDELTQLVRDLKILEDCKERLTMLFANRKRNDAFWDLISRTEDKFVTEKEMREEMRLVIMQRSVESSKLTRFGDRVAGSNLLPFTSGGSLLNMHQVRQTVSAVG